MSGEPRTPPRDTCPHCGSATVTPLRVLEHRSCGAVKPESRFFDGERITCPDCGSVCTDDDIVDVTRGSPSTCENCGRNFSGNRAPGTNCDNDAQRGADDVQRGADDVQRGADDVLESVRERTATATPSTHRLPRVRRVLMVVVIFLVVSSSGVSVVGTNPVADDQVASESSSWNEYRSIVVFRNDDIQPHYRTEEMRAVDRVFVEADVPVTQGVIPAISDGELAPDQELCRYLRAQARNHPETFEYALHGYTHQQRSEFHGGSEFGGLAPNRQRELLRNGTRALGDCVRRTPTTFIPPLDTYDDATATALAEENYAVVSGGGWFTRQYYDETGPFEARGVLHLPNSQSFVKNWTTNEFHDRTYLERQFDSAYRNGDVYVQMLHYPTFTDRSQRQLLREFIDYVKSKEGVAFMTVGEFAWNYRNDRLERTENGWRVEETTDGDATNATRRAAKTGPHVRERIASRSTPGARIDG